MQKPYRLPMKCFRLLILSSVSIFILIISSYACDIQLKSSAVVSSKNITLKTIASRYPKKWANTILCDAPYTNNSITLTKTYIKALLKNRGIDASICGAELVKITSKAFLLTQSKLNSILNKRLNYITKLPIKLPFKNWQFSVVKIQKSKDLMFITLKAYTASQKRFISIIAKQNISATLIPVASHSIELGQIITASDITFKAIPQTYPGIFKNKKSIIGRVAVSFIPAGKPFSIANTRRFKPVRLGDIVKVKVKEGNIIIYTTAKALKGGYSGDIIPIMYLSSRRVLPAQIIGKKLVEVQ